MKKGTWEYVGNRDVEVQVENYQFAINVNLRI